MTPEERKAARLAGIARAKARGVYKSTGGRKKGAKGKRPKVDAATVQRLIGKGLEQCDVAWLLGCAVITVHRKSNGASWHPDRPLLRRGHDPLGDRYYAAMVKACDEMGKNAKDWLRFRFPR